MVKRFGRLLARIRDAIGFTSDIQALLVAIGVPGGLGALTAYFGWATEKAHWLIVAVTVVVAASAIGTLRIIDLIDRLTIFRRLKVVNLTPHGIVGVDPEKKLAAMTMQCSMQNASKGFLHYKLQRVSLMIEGRAAAENQLDATVQTILPADRAGIIIATVRDIPLKPSMSGRLSLDILYGHGQEDLGYRFEYSADVVISAIIAPGKDTGQMAVVLRSPQLKHSKAS